MFNDYLRFEISNLRLRLQISDSRFQIPDSRFQIPDSRFQISNFRSQISDLGFQISNLKFQISDFRFQISNFKFQISNDQSLMSFLTDCPPSVTVGRIIAYSRVSRRRCRSSVANSLAATSLEGRTGVPYYPPPRSQFAEWVRHVSKIRI